MNRRRWAWPSPWYCFHGPLRRMRTLVLALGLATGLAACDRDDTGPGSFDGSLQGGEAVAAVVLELRGLGIESVEGAATTRAMHAQVGPADAQGIATHRVVLIAEGSDAIRFEVQVQDVSAGAPSAAVISAADADNRMLPSVGGVSVSLRR